MPSIFTMPSLHKASRRAVSSGSESCFLNSACKRGGMASPQEFIDAERGGMASPQEFIDAERVVVGIEGNNSITAKSGWIVG